MYIYRHVPGIDLTAPLCPNDLRRTGTHITHNTKLLKLCLTVKRRVISRYIFILHCSTKTRIHTRNNSRPEIKDNGPLKITADNYILVQTY